MVLWILWGSATTTATSMTTTTATATTERFFEALRVNEVEVLSAVRWRIYRFFYGSTGVTFYGSVQWHYWWCSGLWRGTKVLSGRKNQEVSRKEGTCQKEEGNNIVEILEFLRKCY